MALVNAAPPSPEPITGLRNGAIMGVIDPMQQHPLMF